jgi:hypothetical protein
MHSTVLSITNFRKLPNHCQVVGQHQSTGSCSTNCYMSFSGKLTVTLENPWLILRLSLELSILSTGFEL